MSKSKWSKVADHARGVDTFFATLVGVEVPPLDPKATCPGVDTPWLGLCGKPGPHSKHRGDEPPPYRSR